ncbi:MAG: GNAT family N-acetyltransferase [Pseudomonadota bacterium]
MTDEITFSVTNTLSGVSESEWDALGAAGIGKRAQDPFLSHRFLTALEESGSVGKGTGWHPQYVLAHQNDRLVGAMPAYAKTHSQGEYIFDHNWAHAYENAGGAYYPKYQIAVPFTPATGRRFLGDPARADIRAGLFVAARSVTLQQEWSGLHITFCTKEEFEWGGANGALQRTNQQFHWFNKDYADFDAFLADLSSRKRKNIRKERARAAAAGEILALTGDDLQPEHWDAFFAFYMDTGMRKWGTPYLTRQFFDIVQETMRDDVLLLLCRRNGDYIAGALNFIGSDCLYGRYWGCVETHDSLHFELCYYQAIDYAIDHGLARVEAGAQGAHKLARGYMPSPVYSLHYFPSEPFSDAIEKYLRHEKRAVEDEIEIMTGYGPFKMTKGLSDEL